jgi:flavin-dependent dehydrogenase
MTALDAIVVGAGPAGSAVAAALSRVGARVVLVERAHHPRPKACAEYASPRIVDELARIGLPFEAWSTDAVPLSGMHLHAGGRVVRIEYADRTGRRPAWGVDRRRFDARLAEHAAASGAELREGVAVVDVSLDDGRVSGVRLRDLSDGRDEALRAPWVIGADGARSSVARLLGVERRVGFPRRLGLVAHHSGIPALTDHGEMHVGNG